MTNEPITALQALTNLLPFIVPDGDDAAADTGDPYAIAIRDAVRVVEAGEQPADIWEARENLRLAKRAAHEKAQAAEIPEVVIHEPDNVNRLVVYAVKYFSERRKRVIYAYLGPQAIAGRMYITEHRHALSVARRLLADGHRDVIIERDAIVARP